MMADDNSEDIYSRLLSERIIFLTQAIDDDLADTIVAQLLYLEAENPQQTIQLYINSAGGSVTSGMAIFDTMQHIQPDISTVCVGLAAGMAAFLLSAGTKGKRFSTPNSQIVITPLSTGVRSEIDLQLQAQEIEEIEEIINQLWASNTGQPLSKIKEDTKRDLDLAPIEAIEYGLIDRIIDRN
jgi:ATP-dependent Clp protease, protease subunit